MSDSDDSYERHDSDDSYERQEVEFNLYSQLYHDSSGNYSTLTWYKRYFTDSLLGVPLIMCTSLR